MDDDDWDDLDDWDERSDREYRDGWENRDTDGAERRPVVKRTHGRRTNPHSRSSGRLGPASKERFS